MIETITNMEYIKLSNGNMMPKIGLGTDSVLFVRKLRTSDNIILRKAWSLYYSRIMLKVWNKQLSNSIIKAFQLGYRLIDTSAAYANEEAIGRAIKKCGIPREEIFIQTRITNKQQYSHSVRESFFASLKKLGVDNVDMYMIHWPVTDFYLDTWREMEKLYKEGYIKNLGVANCHQHHIENILKMCEVRPVLNQIEVHPLFTQKPLIDYCKTERIQVEAYSPIAQNNDRLRNNKKLKNIASSHGKSLQQVVLRWHIQNGVIPVPRSTNTTRLASNIDVFDFSLTEEEMKIIDAININSRLRYDPDNCDFTEL